MKALIGLTAAAGLLAATAQNRPLTGLWDATVTVNGVGVPFRMEIAAQHGKVTGSFFNGEEKVTSTRGHLDGDLLVLEFDEYASKLEASWKNDRLEGRYDRGPSGFYPFHASRFLPVVVSTAPVPSIAGLWNVQIHSTKGESAWRLIVRQSGAEVSAAILRIDGDTGALTGSYKNGMFTLSHFSGARPSFFELTPQPDGTLEIVQRALAPPRGPNAKPDPTIQNGRRTLVAVRSDDPRAANLPQPSDPSRFTTLKDPTEPLRFSFPDLRGRVVSNTDSRFRGKVVLVNISGSWCPNCHDEAPFLAELYRTYRPRGLEILCVSFEEAEQLQNLARLRAFVERYRIAYPVLVAGKPEELADRLPQAVNLNSFPTTFLIGRDGLVRSVHAGFPGKASGSFYDEARKELTDQVERLLAERVQRSD